ncbi:MAG: bifunctional (p)ppGpp synthetase/guanosine-3',5'-bis(diphosphate) 3'-pyrophosphohydrolase [Candidatus Melainabacteria bacterium]|nr:bifunctional (p)ppGpp synthetase/guanosine-3',5'-bis(diphosphate) 3'-pyrophosphohydrolase [Candidatus Melainabacteria bacterium]
MASTIESALFAVLARQARPATDIAAIHAAYEFAYQSHEGQLRKSEEPYIIHPVGVATILAELNGDTETICAALLHDVLEDCAVKPKDIEDKFGPEIRKIVEGVTKLGKFSFSSKEERQAENFRKLIVAIAEDARVVLVKLADRLHNMQTLDYLNERKQKEIAQETLEIYAPLANRFGLGEMKWQLEDLSLRYLHPEDYNLIQQLVADNRAAREALIQQVILKLYNELETRGIAAEIVGRPKHLFSIWKKIRTQDKSFEELYDVLAIRVIIDSNQEKNYCELGSDPDTQKCYEVMGIVHNLFKPIPGRFKDYIAMPKANSYQSLHTAVLGLKGRPVEIQIRTRRMHYVAEYGIAAHWRYKESGESVKADSHVDRKLSWLRQLVEWQQDLKDAQEYLDTVKMDLFADEVFVFSPRGDVFDLPTGSTPIDFAYRIHTDVGHHCIGARVNDRIVPLNTPLNNGDIAEIITAKNAHPHMDWLNFAQTHGAKNKIRQWFKKHHREEHIQQGRQMLEAELGKPALDEFLRSDKLKEVGKKLNISEVNDILASVGYGDLSVAQVVNRIREPGEPEKPLRKSLVSKTQAAQKPSYIGSLGGLMHHLAKCCSPVPGEEIVGVVTRGSGIAVHRSDCTNLLTVDTGRQMAVDWSAERHSTYPASLKVECIDRVGIAGDLLKKISDNKINLRDLRVETRKDTKTATINLVLDVVDIDQLTKISQVISQISDVLRVQRQDHRKKGTANNTLTSSNVTALPKTKVTHPHPKRAKSP